jgi:pyruvate/2-oxoglutarate dehydrogenase complex dihydrolipoamide dehydrogenase (E3) component
MFGAVFDLVIVGMGSAGVSAAEFAARLDLSVAVVERNRIGGDRLWTGSVPSKALLAAARAAHGMRTADRVGLEPVEPSIDLSRVWRRIRAVQAQIAAGDDVARRFLDLGVDVIQGAARVTGPEEVTVSTADGADRVLATRFVLVCTGSRPRRPAIPGLEAATTFTSDDVFRVESPPSSMAVIGGGPMGVEMAQGLQRLGITTTLFQRAATLLPREDPVLVERLTEALAREGLAVHCASDIRSITVRDGRNVIDAVVGDDGARVEAVVGGVLLATGRSPNVEGLGLEELGVVVTATGVAVDDTGRTGVRTIYAVGDVAGGEASSGTGRLLTNVAGQQGVVAVRNMFFPGRSAADPTVPSCVFTDPELARVGLTEEQAEATFGSDADSWRFDLADNDRARLDATTDGGFVVVTGKGRVVGAHVLAPGAGEVIHELALAVQRQVRVEDLTDLVHVYPTIASGIGQLATEAAYEKAHRLRWLMKRGEATSVSDRVRRAGRRRGATES